MHITNRVHIPVCSDSLSCLLSFDYGIYNEFVNDENHALDTFQQYVALILTPPCEPFMPPRLVRHPS